MEQELDPGTPANPTQIHLVALPHTQLTKAYDWCAYTAKLRRFTHMLVRAGYTPVVYGADEHECAEGTIYVPIIGDTERKEWFGTATWDINTVFDHWDADAPCWRQMNIRAAVAIATYWRPGDILGLIAGRCQQLIPQMLKAGGLTAPIVWEWGIGYSGVLPDTHHTYESYAWAHHVAGLRHHDDVRFYDSVVPNCFDADDFTPSLLTGDYLLYLGRPTARKGLPIIAEIAKHTDIPIKIAGQPGADIPGTEYVGVVLGAEKAQLLAGARALLAPTTYLEPFGGVAVEAMLSGTPVITTDWGAFTETVEHGVTGYRCHTLQDFLDAVEDVERMNRGVVVSTALSKYTLDAGSAQYDQVIQRLLTLYGDGWYTLRSTT